jgi:Na+/H+ antiporter NhaD/arsenite permease-like protein
MNTAQLLILFVFLAGYLAIIFEHRIRVNKAASALIAGVLAWTIYILFSYDKITVGRHLMDQFGGIAGILFFLLSAMTIVELIDVHDGFEFITERISRKSKRALLWITGFITFFLSSVLDNLTTTIVMISLIRKLIPDPRERWIFAGIIIISANAGGAWSPMGDVTTTMLWIGDQISAFGIIFRLFLPSLICTLIPLIAATFMIPKSTLTGIPEDRKKNDRITGPERNFVFFFGLASLLSVPLFKTLTDLPPYMGMLLALGFMWLLTEFIHRRKEGEEKDVLSVARALRNTDAPTIQFFLGILLCISAMESTGILKNSADFLSRHIHDQGVTVLLIGLLSAVVDNVPLVAAVQGMYPLSVFPTDHFFWEFIAYATGTGGSILIIGSAAGIAAMGMEKISFFFYLKRISLLALAGYFAGALVYYIQFRIIF